MVKTCFAFPSEIIYKVQKVLSDIGIKDESFIWRITESKSQRQRVKKYPFEYIAVIESETKDKAHKRGLWLTKKALRDYGLLYWVKE